VATSCGYTQFEVHEKADRSSDAAHPSQPILRSREIAPVPSVRRPKITELEATAHHLADLAGAAILPHFRRPIRIDNKAARGFDPVTVADKAAERAMRTALAKRYPDHAIEGEEYADAAGAGAFTWVLDPIDGTRAFIMGYPLWGTLIGVKEHTADGARAVFGMMDQPFTGERFYASRGAKAATWRGKDGTTRRLKTRKVPRLVDCILGCTTPDMFTTARERERFGLLSSSVRMTRFGGDCYAYCMLAAGHVDLVVEAGLKAVDILPLVPIIEAAGGVVSTWDGGPATAGGQVIAAGDAAIHASALKILAG
jgi:myo-inositol-1(or 4)-monophosphatase